MRTLVLALLAALALSAAAAAGSVTFQKTYGHHALDPAASCVLDVPTPTTGAAVLDAAVAAGCIESWTSATFAGSGRYVTCIDGLCELPGTFWAFFLDEAPAAGGIDNTNGLAAIEAGAVVEFVYADWFTPFLVP